MQSCVRRNARPRRGRGAISQFWRDHELAFAADFHAHQTEIPTLNDLVRTDHKTEWLVAVF